MTKSMKRIHKVTIKRLDDRNPDTSYLEQDGFEDRRAQYQNDQFSFVGVRAEAEFFVGSKLVDVGCEPIQTLTSGGLWGIESDSAQDYFTEIEQEQLSELRDQLHAIGFSNRAISAAFRNVEREGN